MRIGLVFRVLLVAALLDGRASGGCIHFRDARDHVGDTGCVTGKVLRVEQGSGGVHFLDFCSDYRVCPFTVVVFPGDLKRVGDVRQLQGQDLEIHGKIKLYDDRAEIVLSEPRQIGGKVRLPPIPRDYDVERRGSFSAGSYHKPKSSTRKTARGHGAPATIEQPEVYGPGPD